MVNSFIRLLENIADNKHVLGDRMVETGFSGPTLEAVVSIFAIAQGELGHARVLYSWASRLRGGQGDPDIAKQTGKALGFLSEIDDWIKLVSAMYTVTIAHDVLLRSIFEARPEESASRVHKVIEEQKEYFLYAKAWVQQLLKDKGAVPKHMKKTLDHHHREVLSWLESIENQRELFEGGHLKAAGKLSEQFREKFEEGQLSEVGVHA